MTVFTSAYRQLRAPEKAFVDGYVADVANEAQRRGERLSLALYRAIPADTVEASRGMLEKPLVLAAITERITQITADSELSVPRVVREVCAIAFSNMENYVTIGEDGKPSFNLENVTTEQWAAVQSLDIEMDPRNPFLIRSFKLRLHPKMTGIDMLAKYTGMMEPDNPHWRADNARPVGDAALPASTSVDAAADRYAAMING